MTQKRKAEIQRRLSLRHVPAPPEGLADRIKADIPKYLDPAADRERMKRSIWFNLRVAAAVLLMLGSTFALVTLVTPDQKSPVAMSDMKSDSPAMPQTRGARAAVPPAAIVTETTSASAPSVQTSAQTSVMDEVRVDVVQEAAPRRLAANEVIYGYDASAAPAPPPPPPPPPALARDAVERGVEGRVAGGVAGGTIAATAAAPPVPEPAAVPPADFVTEAREETALKAAAPMPSLVREAHAAELDFAPRDRVFGISIERDAFQRIRNAVENGERPSAANVNVEALVNYFAGTAKRSPRDVRLELEGSPSPVATGTPSNGPRAVIRFTVDTAQVDVPAGATVPPIATDAQIEVILDPRAVTSHRRVSGSTLIPESALLKNVSVTGLYELQLKQPLSPRQRVATVRLTYKSIEDGRQRTIERTLRASDLARTWMAASRRHRLASLGAVWGETLRTAGSATDVARKAEELANREPKDESARELAEVAKASTRL